MQLIKQDTKAAMFVNSDLAHRISSLWPYFFKKKTHLDGIKMAPSTKPE